MYQDPFQISSRSSPKKIYRSCHTQLILIKRPLPIWHGSNPSWRFKKSLSLVSWSVSQDWTIARWRQVYWQSILKPNDKTIPDGQNSSLNHGGGGGDDRPSRWRHSRAHFSSCCPSFWRPAFSLAWYLFTCAMSVEDWFAFVNSSQASSRKMDCQ